MSRPEGSARPKHWGRASVCGAIIGSLLTVGFVTPASAASPPPPTSPETAIVSTGFALTAGQEAELNALDAATSHALETFDPAAAAAAGASEAGIADYAYVLNSQGWTVVNEEFPTARASTVAIETAAAAAACTGRSGYTGFYGAFWQWALNSCQTDTLIAAVAAGGGGTAAIGGLLTALGVAPAGAITAAVGGLVVAGSGFLTVCKTASYGVHAIYLNAYVTGGVGCWGQ